MRNPEENPLLEVSPFSVDGGELIGRDPRKMEPDEFPVASRRTRTQAIRANCFECAGTEPEVRKCVATNCAFWPWRLGTTAMVTETARKERARAEAIASGTYESAEPEALRIAREKQRAKGRSGKSGGRSDGL